MKAAIFNPYFDTLGGGERYSLGAAQAFLKAGYKVDIEWHDENILEDLHKRFGLDLKEIKVVDNINRGDGYDACFWVSDGSIPTLRSRNNILHFQFPFTNVNGRTLMNKMKLFRIKNVVVNSEFTKSFVDPEYGIKSKVIYPPVSVGDFKPKRKQNVISYIGRFSALTQAKRQDILIDVFRKFHAENNNWKLVLAGGVEVGNDGHTEHLRQKADGLPVEIIESPPFSEVKNILGVSKMFWSAAGYGIDETKKPQKVEHFGITVVEAMAASAVPLVVNKGGYKEIVKDSETGYLWNSKEDLLKKAIFLSNNYSIYMKLAKAAHAESPRYSQEAFEKQFLELI